jgi:glycosyltransferase involved in cell wall biosynthesis
MVKMRSVKSSTHVPDYLPLEPGPERPSRLSARRISSARVLDAAGAPTGGDGIGEAGHHSAAASAEEAAATGEIEANPPQHPESADESDIGGDPPLMHELRGRIEKTTEATIAGWVWDPQTPDRRIRLELLDGETQLSVTVANSLRQELIQLGCGDGRYGFSIGLEDGQLSQARHVLTLRCADTGAAMPGSPMTFERGQVAEKPYVLQAQPRNSEPGPTYRAFIDKVTDREILGWIMLPDDPTQRYVVALKEGARLLSRTVASQFRSDILSADVGDGCYAFVFEPPPSLSDGNVHLLDIIEENTGSYITKQPIRWCPNRGNGQPTSGHLPDMEMKWKLPGSETNMRDSGHFLDEPKRPDRLRKINYPSGAHVGTRILFDISDLVYYIGHHANLTGIQRVQSSIVLAMVDGKELAAASMIFLSFDATTRNWVAIPSGFLISLLRDLFLPDRQRMVRFSAEAARYGVLPGAVAFDGIGVLDDGNPSVLCLLGAAWVHQDYLHRVLMLKRQFGTRFVMTIHDLIPIYARDTCDQDTSRVFEEFMRRALRHVDHILAVSDNTAKDVRRYLGTLQLPEPPITVTRNGSSFTEFLPKDLRADATTLRDLPERFVLFVATIEGRKNHQFIFEMWQRMVDAGEDPPHLICVGRLGWKAAAFVSVLVETNYLGRRIHLLREISDVDLRLLYARCLFTVCPSFYEGWGLPVGEALAMGKICVCSDRSSIPEVAGACGIYIDIDDFGGSLTVVRDLIRDGKARGKQEAKIRRDYVPITWRSVAQRVAAACQGASAIEWQEPYPYTALPYSTEISFGRLDPDIDGKGESLLVRIIDARLGHFKFDPIDHRGFLLGEEARASGIWAQPELWGSWLCQAGGEVEFSLAPDDSQFYFVSVRLRVCGTLDEELVTISANGEMLWRGEIGRQSKDIMVRVAKKATATGRWKLRIGAQLNVSADARTQLTALDSRIPTVGFERLIVVPERDAAARLDMMTKRLL